MNSVIAKTRAEAKAMGIAIYHTGKPCPKGHNDGRYASGGQCVSCALLRRQEALKDREAERARQKAWRDKNRERHLANRRAYNLLNIERERARRRADNKKHYEKRAETMKAYRAKNQEKISAQNKEWRKNNAELVKKRLKENRDYVRYRAALRRARLLNAIPKWLSDDDKKRIREIHREARIMTDETGVEHHADHIVPLTSPMRQSLSGDFFPPSRFVGPLIPIVQGLHVSANLCVMVGADNKSKLNRRWPDMP